MNTTTTTIAAKVPTGLAARIEALASQRRLTVSLLIRAMAERELEADNTLPIGPIEATTRARLGQITDTEAFDPRASVACELARRLDVDPSNGAQHSRELMRLLDDLEGEARALGAVPTHLDELRARMTLKRAGYGLTEPNGTVLTRPDRTASSALADDRHQWNEERARVMYAISDTRGTDDE